MRLEQLQLIQVLASCGSLRAAAQQMNVTQPALTKALRLLEEEFRAPLVLRTPKGVRLTPAGELVAQRAATVTREIERAREDVAWQTRHTASHVAVGVSPAAAIVALPGALARVRARWPQLRVRVVDAVYPRALTMLRGGEIDLAVGPLPREGAGHDLRVQAIFDAQQVLVARRGHPLARARSLAAVQHADWILAGPGAGPGDPIRLGFQTLGLAVPAVTLTCESFSTLVALLRSGDAISIMPESFYVEVGAPSGLVLLPIDDPLPRVTVHLVWRAEVPLTAPAGHLFDALEQEGRRFTSDRSGSPLRPRADSSARRPRI